MQVTLRQISNSYQALQRLSQQRLPAKLSYKLSRVIAGAEAETRLIQAEIDKIIIRHGELIANTDQYRVKPELAQQAQAEADEFLETVSELWGSLIKLEELGELQIAPADLMALDWLIVDGEAQAQNAPAQLHAVSG